MANLRNIKEEVESKIKVYDTPLRFKRGELARHFQEGAYLIMEYDEDRDIADVCAVYPLEPGERTVHSDVRRVIYRLYPDQAYALVEPRKTAVFLDTPQNCESEMEFLTAEKIQHIIDDEKEYADNPDDVTIYYTAICKKERRNDRHFTIYAVSSYSYEENGKEVEAAFPFYVRHMRYADYLDWRKQCEKKADEEAQEAVTPIDRFLNTPGAYKKLYRYLEERVLGQDELYKVAYSIYAWAEGVAKGKKTKKSIFLTAPSGSGKTELMRTLADFFQPYGLKVMIADTANMTSAGIKGTNPMEVLEGFYENDKTVCGILCLDEIDKKMVPSINGVGTDYNKEILDGLLAVLEGNPVNIIHQKRSVVLDSSQIFILAGGSLNHLREERQSEKAMGFGSAIKEAAFYDAFTEEEMLEASYAEFIGRFSCIVHMKQLKYNDFLTLLRRYRKALEKDNDVRIFLSQQYKKDSYQKFKKSKLGCRSVFNELFNSTVQILHCARMEEKKNIRIYVRNIHDLIVKEDRVS